MSTKLSITADRDYADDELAFRIIISDGVGGSLSYYTYYLDTNMSTVKTHNDLVLNFRDKLEHVLNTTIGPLGGNNYRRLEFSFTGGTFFLRFDFSGYGDLTYGDRPSQIVMNHGSSAPSADEIAFKKLGTELSGSGTGATFTTVNGANHEFSITLDFSDYPIRGLEDIPIIPGGGGLVGIGVEPEVPLDVKSSNGATNARALQLRAGDNGTGTDSYQILFGYAGNSTYRHAISSNHSASGGTNSQLNFWTFNSSQNPTDIPTRRTMTLTGNGRVGINGNSSPSFNLDVNGSGRVTAGMYIDGSRYTTNYGGEASSFYHPNTTTTNPANYNYTLTLEYACRAQAYVAYSDRRIKENIEDVDDASALEILRNLKPKKYTYKDTIKRGTTPVWGWIADEVRDTLPYATSLTVDYIPNIYELANVSQSNVITFTNFNTSNFENTLPTLKLKDKEDMVQIVKVTSIIDEHSVSVEDDLSEWCEADTIFVYGEEVSDFVALDKSAIFTIATASVQELDKQLQEEKNKVADLLARVEALESR